MGMTKAYGAGPSMNNQSSATMAGELRDLLGLSEPPIAMTFAAAPPEGVAPFAGA